MLRTRFSFLSRIHVLTSPASVRLITRTASTATGSVASKKTESTKKPEPRVVPLLRALKSSIDSTDDHELIPIRVKENLDTFIPRLSRPHRVYDGVIRFLIRHSYLTAAAAAREHMVAGGFILPLSLEAQMFAVAMANTESTEEKTRKDLFSSLLGVVKNQQFTDDNLWSLLETMNKLGLPAETLLKTMSTFYGAHESNDSDILDLGLYKKFLHSGTESGNVEQALDTLSTLPDSGGQGGERAGVYASFIAGVRDTPHPNRDAVSAALDLMKQQEVEPDITVFNALISLEVRTNSLQRAFAIYSALKANPAILPDDFTFGSLFSALNRLYSPNRRRYRHGRYLADDIPSPRTLYHDMIDALVRSPRAPTFEITTSLLNVVLRSFIYKKDYVGAYVVVRCFTTFHISVNVKTYFIVFRHLLNRITYGIRAFRKMGDDKWADRFLSLPYPVHDPQFLAGLQLSNALAAQILDASRRHVFKLDWPLYITNGAPHSHEHEKYKVPSVENMLGKDPIALDHPFDCVPLERLLKKAILAEADSMRTLGHGQAANSYVSKAIQDAKKEMVPPTLSKRLKALPRRQKTVGSA